MTEVKEGKQALKVALVYFSQTGVTAQMVQAIAEGIQEAGQVKTLCHQIQGQEIVAGRFVNPALFEILAEYQAFVAFIVFSRFYLAPTYSPQAIGCSAWRPQ